MAHSLLRPYEGPWKAIFEASVLLLLLLLLLLFTGKKKQKKKKGKSEKSAEIKLNEDK